MENLAPSGFDPRTVQPVGSRYTDYANRPTTLSTVVVNNYGFAHGTSPLLKGAKNHIHSQVVCEVGSCKHTPKTAYVNMVNIRPYKLHKTIRLFMKLQGRCNFPTVFKVIFLITLFCFYSRLYSYYLIQIIYQIIKRVL